MKDYDTEIVQKVNTLLDQDGYTMQGFFQTYYAGSLTLMDLPDDAFDRYRKIYEKLCQGDISENITKGNLLEELIECLFAEGYEKIFDVYRQCRTSTNEIDILLHWTNLARVFGISYSFEFIGDSLLCECKNYKKTVDVTYVGKFYSLMRSSRTNVGLMIAWNGISGRGKWDSAKGLVKKIVLRDNCYIIVIDKEDLRRIYLKETNIFSLLYQKYESLKLELDYSKYIEKHPAEDALIKTL